MNLGISGERALVLGGTQGLGLSCARALANEGVAVAAVGRDPAAGAAAVESIVGRAVYVRADLSVAADRARLVDEVAAVLGEPVSILVTNAGGPPTGEFAEHSTEAWLAALQINMLGHLEIARTLLPGMTGRGFGRIVNITSFAAKEPYPNMALANAVRAGLHGAMSTLAREVADKGVTVNNLLPGLIDTGALQRV